ncbi:hypothetical protein NSE_0764 [Neorickettsia sennetsu str. Miyayama]|uniref:Uncharacterized protein n=1 Tax=Ehrlichia sennetsu (strain ATCC VR-367 / Miyayama) TaxID=222891 RepID=Q2GD07_EHRS3|nr:hypothetical protein NSE_0764 [Neorickettsia sennetsu str. Miyayama]
MCVVKHLRSRGACAFRMTVFVWSVGFCAKLLCVTGI